jgi:superoxide dismutase, Fe-Mn family
MVFTVPPLPYPYDALEPHIDARTMELHHDKHHATYVAGINKAIEGIDLDDASVEDLLVSIHSLPENVQTAVRNHGGGHANHSLFWTILSHDGGGQPKGELARAINQELGGFDAFKQAITKAALGRFGSGWAWLSLGPDQRLLVEDTANQDSPLMQGRTPIMGIDVWEHAYYLKYQNRRADYLAAIFNVFDWDAIARRYQESLREAAAMAHR